MRQTEGKADSEVREDDIHMMNNDIKHLYELFLHSEGANTDTRTIRPGEMFFALKGENFDGNEYAMKALEAGAAYAIVSSDS